MIELELTRASEDRRLYALDGIGTVRLEGLFSSSATAQSSELRWHFDHTGFWRRAIQATDAEGSVVGEFARREIRRGGSLRWADRSLMLRPLNVLRERYVLSDGDRDLALLDGKGWGRRPVKITLPEAGAIEPGLLLFAAFVVHRLAANAANASSAGTTAAVSGSSSSG